jgi:hypothetical protein
MNQDKSEKGAKDTEKTSQRNIKYIYILYSSIFVLLILISGLVIFFKFCNQDSGSQNYDEPRRSGQSQNNNEPRQRPANFYSSNTLNISDEDFKEEEVFTEYKSEAMDFTEIKKDIKSDFIEKLKEVTMRTKVPVGIVKSGDSNYASTVIQALFRIPSVRKVLGNLEIFNEYHASRIVELEHERSLIKVPYQLEYFDSNIMKSVRSAKVVANDLNCMFSRLQTSEKNLVKFHPENLLKLNFDENFTNFKHAGNYFLKLINFILDFVPESQHKHLLIHFKDNCKDIVGNYEEDYKKAALELYFEKEDKDFKDLMNRKFIKSRTELEWKSGPPVQITKVSKLISLPKIVSIQITRLSTYIDEDEMNEDEILCGYHGPEAPKKRVDGKFKGTYKLNDHSIKMPLIFDFSPYFDKSVSKSKSNTKYNLKMLIKCEEIELKLVYTLILKENDSKWYKIQDKRVDQIFEPTDELNFGWIYFYEQEN